MLQTRHAIQDVFEIGHGRILIQLRVKDRQVVWKDVETSVGEVEQGKEGVSRVWEGGGRK